jgi:hypothetical protein
MRRDIVGNDEHTYVERVSGAPFLVDGPGCTPAAVDGQEERVTEAGRRGREAANRVLRASGAIPPGGPYLTQGKCDECVLDAAGLVNGLAPCACSVGLGAPKETCRCAWGTSERRRARRAAEKAAETPQPPRCHHAETGENPGAGGAGREKREAPRLGDDGTPKT